MTSTFDYMQENCKALLNMQPDLKSINADNLLWYNPSLATIDEDLVDGHAQFTASRFPSGFKLNITYRIFDENGHKLLDTTIKDLACNNPYPNKMYVVNYVKNNNKRLNGLVLPYPEVKNTLELEVIETWFYDFNNLYIDSPFVSRPFTHAQRFIVNAVSMSKLEADNIRRSQSARAMELDRYPERRIDDYFDFGSLSLQSLIAKSQFLYFTSEGQVLNQEPDIDTDILESALKQVRKQGVELKSEFKADITEDLKKPFRSAMFCSSINYQAPNNNQNGYNHNGFGSMLIDVSETVPKFKLMMPFVNIKAKHYPRAFDFEDKYVMYVPKYEKAEI